MGFRGEGGSEWADGDELSGAQGLDAAGVGQTSEIAAGAIGRFPALSQPRSGGGVSRAGSCAGVVAQGGARSLRRLVASLERFMAGWD